MKVFYMPDCYLYDEKEGDFISWHIFYIIGCIFYFTSLFY